MADEGKKLKLLDSDEEEEIDDDLRIRPLYEGPHGQQMLEINSQIPKRFKLDERFLEDFEPEDGEKKIDEDLLEENKEKMKNIRILETVLGHAVSTKPSDKNIRKQLIRFDPEDENASKFVKTPETTTEKPKKSKKKKEIAEKKIEDPVPVSTERYIQVSSDLKEILSSSTPFSFSQHFNFDSEETTVNSQNEICPKMIEEVEVQNVEKKQPSDLVTQTQEPRVNSFIPKSKWNGFFIVEGDPRLKEGITFFKRPKSLEEIRTEWQKRREHVLELFRRKKRSSQRSYSTRVQSVQMKNNIRKSNFKK